ncbi:actin depolymerization factor/cofilin-like domain-containing protein [Streptomyces sp. NPDC021622]|uniref:actin-binding ADF family protein n=1 Tax=Streptomyces sp. NPDC021622 TaxID=3155013 RepID=UPI0033C0D847
MSSDVVVEDSVISAFQGLKAKRTVNTIFCRLSDDFNTIVPDFQGTLTHDELLERLPRSEARYVVYDLAYARSKGDEQRYKITLISWCPDGVTIKSRMVHSSGYNTLQNMLDGVGLYIQAADLSDVEYDELVSRVS